MITPHSQVVLPNCVAGITHTLVNQFVRNHHHNLQANQTTERESVFNLKLSETPQKKTVKSYPIAQSAASSGVLSSLY